MVCNLEFLECIFPPTDDAGAVDVPQSGCVSDNDCGAGYVLHWGYATSHVKMRYLYCPI